MRYVVYGTGAVGGVIGGHLHRAGLPVTLVARGRHLAAIRRDGLVLDTGDGRHRIDAPATDTAADVDWSDDTVVVLAVKSHQAQSLSRGTGDSEIDYLAGEIVLLGRLHDVPTPVNEAVVAATRALAYAGAAPRSLDAAEVLRTL